MHGKRPIPKQRLSPPPPTRHIRNRPKSNVGTNLVLLLSLPLALPVVFVALDGFSGQGLSSSAGGTLSNVTIGAAAGERSVVRAQRDADLQKSVTGTALTVATGAQIGDLALCAGETIIGGILQYQHDSGQQTLGAQMQTNCQARQKGMQARVEDAARSSFMPELSGN